MRGKRTGPGAKRPRARRSALGPYGGLGSPLGSRTSVSPAQARRLRALSDAELDDEIRAIALAVKRFGDAVAAAVENRANANAFLDQLDLRVVTRDHDWREVFTELHARADADDAQKSDALWHYLAYLCSRQGLLDYIRRNRGGLEETNEAPVWSTTDADAAAAGMRRLPHGERVRVEIPYRGELHIRLGRHAFRIVDGYPPKLVDPDGVSQRLAFGRQSVGRHPSNDVVVHVDYCDVSRAHMIIEWRGDSHLEITDLSSRGTCVDAPCESLSGPTPGHDDPTVV